MEGRETAISILDGINIDSFADRIFSPDPLACSLHEKVYGDKQGQGDHLALRALTLAVLEDGIACFQGYFLSHPVGMRLYPVWRKNGLIQRMMEFSPSTMSVRP